MPGPQSWSLNPSSNDTIDPNILFVEGQPPSTHNDSMRAVMTAVKKAQLDAAGGLMATGAAANALLVGTNQVFSASDIASPFEIAFRVDASNTGPATLSVDGTPAKPILRRDSLQLGPNDLRPGPRFRVARTPDFGDAYLLLEPDPERAGTVKMFGADPAIPPNWVPCDGRAVSRTAYVALFGAIGVAHGPGDGSSTFNVPDFRGRAPFGVDAGAGRLTSAGGLAGTIGSGGGAEAVSLSIAQLAAHGHQNVTGAAGAFAGGTTGAAGDHSHGGVTGGAGGHSHTASTAGAGGHNHTGTTDAGGSHVHGIHFDRSQGGGTGGTVVNNIFPTANPGNSTGQVDADGVHGHSFTTTGVGDHAHGVTVVGVGDHGHAIGASGAHTHSYSGAPDHTHAIAIDGSGQAHPNVPPGLVIVFAIKA